MVFCQPTQILQRRVGVYIVQAGLQMLQVQKRIAGRQLTAARLQPVSKEPTLLRQQHGERRMSRRLGDIGRLVGKRETCHADCLTAPGLTPNAARRIMILYRAEFQRLTPVERSRAGSDREATISMYVRNLMKCPVITATKETGAGAALQLMREKIIRRLPIVDGEGRLVGIVNDRALLRLLAEPRRRPSDPIPTVERVMSSPVVTVAPDMPLEEAASTMADQRVGALLVVENERPVGIITDRDLYRIFFDLLGGRDPGLRVTLRAPANVDILADVAIAISNAGGVLRSFGSVTHEDETLMVLKVKYLAEDELRLSLRDFSVEVESIRPVH